jgi:hypothetical protein
MFKLILPLFLLYFFYPSTTNAGSIDNLQLNFGTHTQFYNAVQINNTGDKQRFEFSPTIGVGTSYTLPYGFQFLPEVNWVLPVNQSTGNVIKNTLMLRADFGYFVTDWLRLRSGTSLMILNQHGQGGKTTIENGNTTSTFYYPDENRSSLNNTFDLGIELLKEQWSTRLQTYTYSLFSHERREFSYSLFVSYRWNL